VKSEEKRRKRGVEKRLLKFILRSTIGVEKRRKTLLLFFLLESDK